MEKFRDLFEAKDKFSVGDVWLSNKDRDEITILNIFGDSIGVFSKNKDKRFTLSKEYITDNYIR